MSVIEASSLVFWGFVGLTGVYQRVVWSSIRGSIGPRRANWRFWSWPRSWLNCFHENFVTNSTEEILEEVILEVLKDVFEKKL